MERLQEKEEATKKARQEFEVLLKKKGEEADQEKAALQKEWQQRQEVREKALRGEEEQRRLAYGKEVEQRTELEWQRKLKERDSEFEKSRKRLVRNFSSASVEVAGD